MPPAVGFAEHEECAAVADPLKPGIGPVASDDPGRIGFVEDAGDRTDTNVGDEEFALVAEAAQLLDQQLVGVSGPADLSEIEALCRRGDGKPARLAALDVDDADTQRGNGLANPGEADFSGLWIRGIARDEHRPESNIGPVSLYEGDPLSIGTPGRTTVRNRASDAGLRDGNRPITAQIVDMQIPLLSVKDALAVGRNAVRPASDHPAKSPRRPFQLPVLVDAAFGIVPARLQQQPALVR